MSNSYTTASQHSQPSPLPPFWLMIPVSRKAFACLLSWKQKDNWSLFVEEWVNSPQMTFVFVYLKQSGACMQSMKSVHISCICAWCVLNRRSDLKHAVCQRTSPIIPLFFAPTPSEKGWYMTSVGEELNCGHPQRCMEILLLHVFPVSAHLDWGTQLWVVGENNFVLVKDKILILSV